MQSFRLVLVLLLLLFFRISAARAALPLHSHNDYEQASPLGHAINHRFSSVEADIWRQGRSLQVGHLPLVYRGTLRQLYLLPLLERVLQNQGTVYGDGRTFLLWVEFKDCDPESAELLHEELSRYPIFTEFSDHAIRWNAVTVIVTGDEKNKERMTRRAGPRLATRDAHWLSSADPVANPGAGNDWLWYALDWKRLFDWKGRGAIPARELDSLRSLLIEARSLGRKVRFFNAPDHREYWELARREGFDLVGTDRISDAASYWQGSGARPSIRWKHRAESGQIQ